MAYQNFSYFDQFRDVQVDLTDYLKRFDVVPGHPFTFSNMQPVVATLKNLFELFEIVEDFRNNVITFQRYSVAEGEKVEDVSYKNYDTTDHWWIILLFNDIKNPFMQWPKTEEQLSELADLMFVEEGIFSRDTYYSILFEENEKKRGIVVPKPSYITDIIWEYRQQLTT